jgi:hypothetical protein
VIVGLLPCHTLLGYPEQALGRLHNALALAHTLSHPLSLALAQCWAAIVSQFRRDVSAVHAHAEAAVILSTEQGFAQWAPLSTSLRAWALAMQGQSEEGMAQVRQGLPTVRATGQALIVQRFAQNNHHRPTVCLGATSVMVYTYGCDDGRIGPTHCAVIDAGLGGIWSPRRVCRRPPITAQQAPTLMTRASAANDGSLSAVSDTLVGVR